MSITTLRANNLEDCDDSLSLLQEISINKPNEEVANEIFDIINKSFVFNDKKIKTYIINNEIWTRGNDIASILGYKDLVKAIKLHVDDDDKKALKDILLNNMRGVKHPPKK